ncbi:unnamed protein product [Rhizopus stolonifer]
MKTDFYLTLFFVIFTLIHFHLVEAQTKQKISNNVGSSINLISLQELDRYTTATLKESPTEMTTSILSTDSIAIDPSKTETVQTNFTQEPTTTSKTSLGTYKESQSSIESYKEVIIKNAYLSTRTLENEYITLSSSRPMRLLSGITIIKTHPDESQISTTMVVSIKEDTITSTTESVITATVTESVKKATITSKVKEDKETITYSKLKSTYQYRSLSWLSSEFTYSILTSFTTSSTTSMSPSFTESSIPQYIVPNPDVSIPDSSAYVTVKFTQISYSQMIQDQVLAAQFVQSLPIFISRSLNISLDDVIVVAIAQFSLVGRDVPGLVVSLTIPNDQVSRLQEKMSDQQSTLYDPTNGQLGSLIDPSYFVTYNTSQDDNQSKGLSRPALISICCSLGILIYAIFTGTIYVLYRKKKRAREEEEFQKTIVRVISDPILNPLEPSPMNSKLPIAS